MSTGQVPLPPPQPKKKSIDMASLVEQEQRMKARVALQLPSYRRRRSPAPRPPRRCVASPQAVNEAKKRAVQQRVDFDTFQKMAAAAHLVPIQGGSNARAQAEKARLQGMPAFRFGVDGKPFK